MKKVMMGLVAAMLAATAYGAGFSGKITAIEANEDGLGMDVTIDGRDYLLDSTSSVFVTDTDGSRLYVEPGQLQVGQWILYEISNDPGSLGYIDTIEIRGSAQERQAVMQSTP